MCGFAGYFGNGSRPLLEKMLSAIGHRGPDDRGIEIMNQVGLGHNRLSVIDLTSAGHQPMFDPERTVAIVFNGEIYNFRALRAKLEQKYHFRSSTDTETIIYAYKEYGTDCLMHLRGMFSFVIYDITKNLLFGARDRAGEKPLKYHVSDGMFAFASENKALLPVLGARPQADLNAINHYLTLQYVPAPFTGFKEIYKLPAGHYFIYQDEKLSIHKYWSLDYSKKLDVTENECESLILGKLKESIRIMLEADVPLGAFLSGGVDSSAVVALMSGCSSTPVRTFSIGFEDPKFDETRYAREVANRYGTNHTELVVDNGSAGEAFLGIADHYDEPIADNSVLPTFLLSKLARQSVTVAMTGDGGDENFAGYQRHNIVEFSNYYQRLPSPVRRLVVDRAANTLYRMMPTAFTERAKRFSNTFDEPFHRKYLQYSCFFTTHEKESIFSEEFRNSREYTDTFNLFHQPCHQNWSSLDKALATDVHSYLPEDLLFKTDISSMAFALELRSPFLDHEFMELAAKIPTGLKIKRFEKKYLLKKLLVKEKILPPEVVFRRKQGFNFPLHLWLHGKRASSVKDTVLSSKLMKIGLFDTRKLDSYITGYYAGRTVISSNNIFALMSLAIWANRYL